LATQLTRPDEKHLTMCGTPNYISPEIATRAAHGLETDLWGLGVMLYTILIGKAPFETDDGVKSTLTRVVMAEANMPKSLSSEAVDLLKSLLQKNPKDRMKLTEILDHPFMTKYGVRHNGGHINIPKRWQYGDSGLASSILTSSTNATSNIRPTTKPVLSENNFPIHSPHPSIFGKSNSYCNGDQNIMGIESQMKGNHQYSDCLGNQENQNRFLSGTEKSNFVPSFHPLSQYELRNQNRNTEERLPYSAPMNDHDEHCCKKSQTLSSMNVQPAPDSTCSHVLNQCTKCSHVENCACAILASKHRTDNVDSRIETRNAGVISTHSYASGPRSHCENFHAPSGSKNISKKLSHCQQAEKISDQPSKPKNKIHIPPISSKRLRPVRQKMKNVIVNIIDGGEVCLEFIKGSGGQEKICEVVRISPDGMRVC